MREHNIPQNDVCIVDGSQTLEEITQLILEKGPTVIFAIAVTAEKAWIAIKDLNLIIPNDISLIVYDDTKWIKLLGITAVAHDLTLISETLVTHIIQRLRAPSGSVFDHKKIVLPPFIRERKSVLEIL